jgi:hypothetical protein
LRLDAQSSHPHNPRKAFFNLKENAKLPGGIAMQDLPSGPIAESNREYEIRELDELLRRASEHLRVVQHAAKREEEKPQAA